MKWKILKKHEKIYSHPIDTVKCKTSVYQVMDAHYDFSYQVVTEGAGGIVSSWDFVVLHHWGMKDKCYVPAGISVKHRKVPPNKHYVRYVESVVS
jgi:hypothetical protein